MEIPGRWLRRFRGKCYRRLHG